MEYSVRVLALFSLITSILGCCFAQTAPPPMTNPPVSGTTVAQTAPPPMTNPPGFGTTVAQTAPPPMTNPPVSGTTVAQTAPPPMTNPPGFGTTVAQTAPPPMTNPPGFGTTVPPPVTTPPLSPESGCSSEVAASALWTSGLQNPARLRCNLAHVLFSGGDMIRPCNLSSAVWGPIDFTQCSVRGGVNAFLLLWFQLEDTSEQMVQNRRAQINLQIFPLLNLTQGDQVDIFRTIAIPNGIAVGVTMFVQLQVLTVQVVNSLTNALSNFISVEAVADLTISQSGRGYQGFRPSRTCYCQFSEPDDLFLPLCPSIVNGPPCVCNTLSGCACGAPFFIGNGIECAVDSDLDTYPDAALGNCSPEEANQTYCTADVCPQVFDLEQEAIACSTDLGPDFIGCLTEFDVEWNVPWPNTDRGEVAMTRCPLGSGFASRLCGPQGWQAPDVSECESIQFASVRDLVGASVDANDLPFGERLGTLRELTGEIRGLTAPGNSYSILPSDLNTTNLVIDLVVELLENNLNSTEDTLELLTELLELCSNVLDSSNLNGWTTLQRSSAGSQKLLDNVERYALYLALSANDSATVTTWNASNMAIEFSRGDPDGDAMVFPSTEDTVLEGSLANLPAQITVPTGIFRERMAGRRGTAGVTGTLLRNMEAALPRDVDSTDEALEVDVVSMVISAQVEGRGQLSAALQQDPALLYFSFDATEDEQSVSKYRCAYWQFSQPVGNGKWAFDGVAMTSAQVVNGKMQINCTSTHLTSFAVLVDLSGTTAVNTAELRALSIVSYIGCAISIICLLIAIVFFLCLGRDLLIKVHYFIHLNLSITLLLAYVAFVVGLEPAAANRGACIFIATFLHYMFLSAFCWMLCEGIMLYLMLVVVFSKLSKQWWAFLLIGYGIPIIPVVVSVAVRHDQYGVRSTANTTTAAGNDTGYAFCWLSTQQGVIWAFVGPMLAIICLNVFFMVVALVKVYKTTRSKGKRQKDDNNTFELFKTLFVASVVLLPILGITWVLGIFTVNTNTTVFAWLFTIFNSLQGVFIFVFHVLRSDKVWQSTRAKNLRSKASSTMRSTSSRYSATIRGTVKTARVSSTFTESTFADDKSIALPIITNEGKQQAAAEVDRPESNGPIIVDSEGDNTVL